MTLHTPKTVIPAKAGIWWTEIPAFAGMTICCVLSRYKRLAD